MIFVKARKIISVNKPSLKQLSEKHQQLIQAVYFQERNTAELAQEMGQARNAIRMRLMRIRRALAGCIKRQMRD